MEPIRVYAKRKREFIRHLSHDVVCTNRIICHRYVFILSMAYGTIDSSALSTIVDSIACYRTLARQTNCFIKIKVA